MTRNIILTGLPSVGKTTLVQRVLDQLAKKLDLRIHATGFYTEEVRGPMGRIGFDVVSLSGQRGSLSRKGTPPFPNASPRIGNYLVDVDGFASIAIPELVQKPQTKLIVIDEIGACFVREEYGCGLLGKMEFYSSVFLKCVAEALDSSCVVFGVVPKVRQIQTYSGEHPLQMQGRYLVQAIHRRDDVQMVEVTRANRDQLVNIIAADLERLMEV